MPLHILEYAGAFAVAAMLLGPLVWMAMGMCVVGRCGSLCGCYCGCILVGRMRWSRLIGCRLFMDKGVNQRCVIVVQSIMTS
jgi:hypothetical protein